MLNNKGFTLTEIRVALVLFAVGAIAFAQMQVLSIRGTSFGRDGLTAITLAQQNVEQLKNAPFDAITDNSVQYRNMTITWTVATSGTPAGRYKTILLTVSWTGKSILSAPLYQKSRGAHRAYHG